MDSIPKENSEDGDRNLEKLDDSSKTHIHSKKQTVKKKEVKIFIIPDECIFNKDETPESISKSIRLNAINNDSETSSCDTSMISQASFTMENDIPTRWSVDLREGLTMMNISYSDLEDKQLPVIYSLFNLLSYPFFIT